MCQEIDGRERRNLRAFCAPLRLVWRRYESDNDSLDLHRAAGGRRVDWFSKGRQQGFPHRRGHGGGLIELMRRTRHLSTLRGGHYFGRTAGDVWLEIDGDEEIHAERVDADFDTRSSGAAKHKILKR